MEAGEEPADDAPLVGRAHQHAEAVAHRSSCAPVAVHIRVGRARDLVMHDMIDGGNVQPSRGDVGRQQH